MRTLGIVIAVGMLCGACTQLLGVEDVSVEDGLPHDAAPDGAGDDDGRPPPIDANPIDADPDAPDAMPPDAEVPDANWECTTGPCCTADHHYAPATLSCDSDTNYRCGGAQLCSGVRQEQTNTRYCAGNSGECTGALDEGEWSNISTCGAEQLCTTHGGNAPTCEACQYGCGTNACEPGVIFVFPSMGQYQGNMGGRAGVDATCETTRQQQYANLNCTETHALIGVSAADRLQQMHVNYTIPTDLPVRRPDGTDVAADWNTLIGTGGASLSAPVQPMGGVFWSGQNQEFTCSGWTSTSSSASADAGNLGQTANWLSQSFKKCNELYKIACVCWHD